MAQILGWCALGALLAGLVILVFDPGTPFDRAVATTNAGGRNSPRSGPSEAGALTAQPRTP